MIFLWTAFIFLLFFFAMFLTGTLNAARENNERHVIVGLFLTVLFGLSSALIADCIW